MGASYQVGAPPGPILGSGSNLGYTSNVATLTAAPQWSPNDRLRLRAFVDWQDTRRAQTSPVIFTNAFRPPRIERGFLGQDFAEGRFSYLNYGVTANAKFDSRWSLAAGIFHSVSDTPVSYADLYVNTQPNGLANHVLVGYPDQKSASTSGEIRLTGNFSPANWKQDVVFSLRGRDGVARYGGSDVVDAGEAYIGSGAQVPRPKFAYASRTLDHTQLWSGGVAYQAGRPGLGNIAFGLQHQQYAKSVESPGNLWSHLVDSPWRLYGVAAVQVAKPVSLYSSYTQGFEDSGIAPSSAKNRGAVLPTARTWQVDGGVRIAVTRKVNLIAGLFELDKPYFNLDTNGVDRSLGAQRAKGLELSLAGEIAGNLTLNAGAVIGKVQVLGPKLAAEGVGKNAVGQPHSQFLINVDYGLPFWPAASMDLSVFHFGAVAESVDNSVYAEGVTMYNVGARYKFNVSSARASLRVQVQNITNVYIWNVGYSPGFFQFAPRTIVAYLTVDI
jgi:iron complex outermembrane receptor protein